MAVRGQDDFLNVIHNRNRETGRRVKPPPGFSLQWICLGTAVALAPLVSKLLELLYLHSGWNLHIKLIGGEIDVLLNAFDGKREQNAFDGPLDHYF